MGDEREIHDEVQGSDGFAFKRQGGSWSMVAGSRRKTCVQCSLYIPVQCSLYITLQEVVHLKTLKTLFVEAF